MKKAKLKPKVLFEPRRLLVFIGLFGITGLVFLAISRAETVYVAVETESTIIDGMASLKSSGDASSGQYVEFGTSGLNPNGRGPTGQWPAGFPAYATAADIVTDGSMASLQSALNDLGSSGGVIEHPGNIARANLDRPAGPEIVVRPPIGQRAQHTSAGNPRGSNLLLAGWTATRMILNRDVDNGVGPNVIRNSGWAWCEATKNASISVFGVYSDIEGVFYEIVFREFADPNMGDRGGIRANGAGGRGVQTIVGSVITGTVDQPPAHADTLQSYYDSASSGGNIYVSDSVLWPSWDKMYQGFSNTPEFDNVYVISPTMAPQAWNGPSDISFFSQPYHTTGSAIYRNSTLVGNSYPNAVIQVSNSEFYNATLDSRVDDQGGNSTLSELPIPAPAPTHEQLDDIWSP